MKYFLLVLVMSPLLLMGQNSKESVKLAVLKYSGGGDWYANPTALQNLSTFCNKELNTNINPQNATVDVGSPELFDYPWIHMTGHGNVIFSDADAENLRTYLISGGFLHIDDNYGMDPYVRVAMKKVFPELDWVEVPYSHEIYHMKYDFEAGPPKIHEHDSKPSQGFALLWEGRIVCFYTYESDIGDGWEDIEVHNDPQTKRLEALQMGANLIQYAFEY